jgi:predicted TIM-barrel fold metal-dependent hydrolase
MPSWWGWQTAGVRDRATAHLPALLYERLDELGIDFTILYPSMALGYFEVTDEELSSVLCRAVNRYHARLFEPYGDRCTVGALIPMNTPAQAVAEAEYAVLELGAKSVLMAGYARRPIGAGGYRLDMFGLDSEFDYDPLWAACVDLGVAPVVHSALQQHRVTRSISNYVYNHVNGLAAAHESLCKSLFLAGVTRRFPDLRIGFLEGGVAWACALFAGLVGHWEKRNRDAIVQLDPDRLDVDALLAYFADYGDDAVTARMGELRDYFGRPAARPAQVDEFAAVGIDTIDDLRTRFEPNFYFGCEADDPLVAWAFRDDVNPLGTRLRPVLGSDISHWDVRDMTEPVAEAFELVEDGIITERDFRDLTYVNPVRLHAGPNPDFFADTVCESAAAAALAEVGE